MEEVVVKSQVDRLEDYIALARGGKVVHVEIELKKEKISQKVHPEETEEMKDEIPMYLLVGDYTLNVEGETQGVSKVYVLGSMEESRVPSSGNKNIANQRLKMDYQRLKDAGIVLEEKYF